MKRREPITADAAISKAEALCSRAEYSQAEILKKLTGWGLPSAQAREIVDELVDSRFIDDSRFARAFTAEKVEYARWGSRKIFMGLRAKGVDTGVIKEALSTIDRKKYIAAMVSLLRAKAKTIDRPETYENRSKLLRFMLSRGYETETVVKLLNRRDLWLTE
jgi:regulatory protein